MVRCKRCGQPAKMGRACKSPTNPTKPKENNRYCPLCGWSDKPKKKPVRNLSLYEQRKERKELERLEKSTPVDDESETEVTGEENYAQAASETNSG